MAPRTPRITTFPHGAVNRESQMENEYSPSTGQGAFVEQTNFFVGKAKKLHFRTGFNDIYDVSNATNLFAIDSNPFNPLLVVFYDFEIVIFGKNNIGQYVPKFTLVSPYSKEDAINLSITLYGDFLFIQSQSKHYPYYIDFGTGVPYIAKMNDFTKRIVISEKNRAFTRPRSSLVTGFSANITAQNETDLNNITVDIEFKHEDGITTPTFRFNIGDLLAIDGLLLDDGNKNGYMVLKIQSVLKSDTTPTNIDNIIDIVNNPADIGLTTIKQATTTINQARFIVGPTPAGLFLNATIGAIAVINVANGIFTGFTFITPTINQYIKLTDGTLAATLNPYYSTPNEIYVYNNVYNGIFTNFHWQKYSEFKIPTKYQCKFIVIHSASESGTAIANATDFIKGAKKDYSGAYKPSNITVVTANGNSIGKKEYPLWLVECWTGTVDEARQNPLIIPYPNKITKVANRLAFGSSNGLLILSADNDFFSFRFGTRAIDGFNGYINFEDGINDAITNIFTAFYQGNQNLFVSNGRQTKISTIGGSGIDVTQLGFSNIYVFEGGISEFPVIGSVSETSLVYVDRTKTKIFASIYNNVSESFQPINMSQKNSDIMIDSNGNSTSIRKIALCSSYLNLFYFVKEDGTLGCFILDGGYNQDMTKAIFDIKLGLSNNPNMEHSIVNIATMDIKTNDGYDNILWAIVDIIDKTDIENIITNRRLIALRQERFFSNRFIEDHEFLDFTNILTSTKQTKKFTGAPSYMIGKQINYYDHDNKLSGSVKVDENGNVIVNKDTTKITIGFVYEGYLETVHLCDNEDGGITDNSLIQNAEIGVAFTKTFPQVGYSQLEGVENLVLEKSPNQNTIMKGNDEFYKNALLKYIISNTITDNSNGINSLVIKHSGGSQMNIVSMMIGHKNIK